jgi:hypothetical protein
MNPWRWVDPRVDTVRLADLRAYFLHKGWTLKPNPNPNLLRFEEPSMGRGRPFFQMIPSSDQFSDFYLHLPELITTLSELEDRHPVDVLNDILRCGAESSDANGAERRDDAKTVRPRSRKRNNRQGTTPP